MHTMHASYAFAILFAGSASAMVAPWELHDHLARSRRARKAYRFQPRPDTRTRGLTRHSGRRMNRFASGSGSAGLANVPSGRHSRETFEHPFFSLSRR
ncbi:exported hypothetical protein [uncultured Defluviicoccus sp.]|uniref:Uncharacterized protein n=1 Tax=metagenome TaxID=256318 RepID=A0A380TEW0_9ZZZZ|nr:exported hypothetical protein [uncultured Defluviicoccus sp.]